MNSFASLGTFDLVLCRFVAIYFAEDFKRDLFHRLATAMKPGSPLVLGATETLRGLCDDFEISMRKNATIFVRKPEVRP
jgi:chemotaxis protein methyltransferase CheR